MIRYLLGELDESEKSHLEELVFREESYFTQLQLVEEQLIDDYLENVLPPTQRQKFEAAYLISDRRRQKLQFAKTLKQSLATMPATQTVRESISIVQGFRAFWRMPTMRWIGFAAVLMCLVFGVWFARRSQEVKPDIASQKSAPIPEPTTTPNAQATTLPSPSFPSPVVISSPKQKSLPEHTKSPSIGTIVGVLSPGLFRSNDASETANTIAVSSQTQTIILHLQHTPNPAYTEYRATLETVIGKPLLTRERIKSNPRNQVLRWSIPAQRLAANDYVINLFGKNARGEFEEISDFSFRVIRK